MTGACSSHEAAVDEPEVANGSTHDPDGGSTGERLCNGESAARLVYRNVGGGDGASVLGTDVLFENGSPFLVVDGTCRYWAMEDTFSGVRSGVLSHAQEDALYATLELARWPALAGTYHPAECAFSSSWLRFTTSRIVAMPSCSREDDSAPVSSIIDSVKRSTAELFERGVAVEGAVRFTLVTEDPSGAWPPLVQGLAAPWPLSVPASSLASTMAEAGDYRAGTSRSAEPPDADALRRIRDRFVAAGGPSLSGGFIPIEGRSGDRYQLFVRDAVPYERPTDTESTF
jgi:hypothetical protein